MLNHKSLYFFFIHYCLILAQQSFHQQNAQFEHALRYPANHSYDFHQLFLNICNT